MCQSIKVINAGLPGSYFRVTHLTLCKNIYTPSIVLTTTLELSVTIINNRKTVNSTKLIFAALLLTLAATPALVQAQRRKARPAAKVTSQPSQAEAARAARTKARSDLAKATDEYKASLARLLELREASVRKAAAQTENLRELYKEGIISKNAMELSEGQILEARAAVEEVRLKMGAADTLLAEAMIEDEVAPTLLANNSFDLCGELCAKDRLHPLQRSR